MGKIFDGLTKAGVTDQGTTTYVNNGPEAGSGLADAMRKYAQPSVASSPGEIPMPAEDGSAPASIAPHTPSFSTPDTGQLPTITRPRFFDPAEENRPLTTKGMVLSTVLHGLTGAAAGLGTPRGGNPFESGMNVELQGEAADQRAKNAKIERDLHQAQIDNLPMVRAKQEAEIGESKARSDYYRAGSKRREFFNTRKGLVSVGPSGAGEIVKGTEVDDKPTLEETAEGRQTVLGNLKTKFGKDYGLTPRQEQEYITTGKLTGGAGGDDVSKMQLPEIAIRSVSDPDPKKRAIYKAALGAYRDNVRPNYTPGNQDHAAETKDDQEGTAGTVASKFLVASGNDPLKASQKIDEFVAGNPNVSKSDRAALKRAKDELLKQHNATKKTGKTNPLDSILGNLDLGPAAAASATQ
jgi:hypothetical protein